MALFQSVRKKRRIALRLRAEIRNERTHSAATIVELGGGGMALDHADHLPISLPVQISFTLPPQRQVSIMAVVWWKEGKRTGVRFDPADPHCSVVEEFVEERLGSGVAAHSSE